jgi:hypothetical protein
MFPRWGLRRSILGIRLRYGHIEAEAEIFLSSVALLDQVRDVAGQATEVASPHLLVHRFGRRVA